MLEGRRRRISAGLAHTCESSLPDKGEAEDQWDFMTVSSAPRTVTIAIWNHSFRTLEKNAWGFSEQKRNVQKKS